MVLPAIMTVDLLKPSAFQQQVMWAPSCTSKGTTMPDVFLLFARYFWLLALIMCAINALGYRQSFRIYSTQYPDRALGYQRFLVGFVLINRLDWK